MKKILIPIVIFLISIFVFYFLDNGLLSIVLNIKGWEFNEYYDIMGGIYSLKGLLIVCTYLIYKKLDEKR